MFLAKQIFNEKGNASKFITTAFACAACITDAICRVEAVDDPSPFSLHYSEKSEGPTQPFGIETDSFEILAGIIPIFDPEYTSLRFRSLDYIRGRSISLYNQKSSTIFNFDQSLILVHYLVQ